MNSSPEKDQVKDKVFKISDNLKKVIEDDRWYKTVFETLADGIIITDMNRSIAFVNPKLAQMLRYERNELLGKSALAIVVEEDRPKVIRETEARYKEKKSSKYEVTLKTKYGSPFPVVINATPILGDSTETIGTYAIITDNRDRKLVEKELRNKNNELQTLYNNLLELYVQLGTILAETTNFHSEIFLFTSKDCVYCAPTEEILQEVLASYAGKITYRKVDIEKEPEVAEKYDIMSLPTIVIGEEKITSIPDIYKLHSALFSALVPGEKFRRTRQELDNIINFSPIAIFTLSDLGVLTSMNPLLEIMTGYKRLEILGKNVISNDANNGLSFFHEELVKLFKKGLLGENISVNRLHIKELTEEPEAFSIISLKVVPMATKEGKINEILVLSEDVTTFALQEEALSKSYEQLEELNDKLLQINKERANFVEITTTSLLEPLRNSKELIDQILSGQLGDLNEEIFGTIEYLRSSLINVTKSVLDIFDYSNLETQGYNLKLNKEKVKVLVSEALKTIGSVVIDKGFILMLNISDDIVVWCDSEQVIRILKNLILNAIKFTEKDCNITISANYTADNMVEIAITDNGIGIDKKDLRRIFEQYVKVDPKSLGSGLGLAIAKSLVDVHCGTIVAESKGKNQGATFRFTLPKDKKTYENLLSNFSN